jgi:hypothetical protein
LHLTTRSFRPVRIQACMKDHLADVSEACSEALAEAAVGKNQLENQNKGFQRRPVFSTSVVGDSATLVPRGCLLLITRKGLPDFEF